MVISITINITIILYLFVSTLLIMFFFVLFHSCLAVKDQNTRNTLMIKFYVRAHTPNVSWVKSDYFVLFFCSVHIGRNERKKWLRFIFFLLHFLCIRKIIISCFSVLLFISSVACMCMLCVS